jgi:hypothetical protein
VTRPELAAAIRDLAEDENKEELDRRLERADAASFSSWAEAKARILGSK